MTGTPNGLRVHWAKDTELVAENAGSILHPPLPQRGDHGSKGPDVEAAATSLSENEGKAAESSSCHGFGVRQVVDARHLQLSVARSHQDRVIQASSG
jgi:hypothetical protein